MKQKQEKEEDPMSAAEQNTNDRIKCLSRDQVKEALGISNTLFHDLVKRGELISLKLGRRTVVREVDLRSFVENLKRA